MAMYRKEKIFEETFVSPFEKETMSDALQVLNVIRSAHPSSSGWIEYDAGAEQLPNGKWRAYRHHAQFR